MNEKRVSNADSFFISKKHFRIKSLFIKLLIDKIEASHSTYNPLTFIPKYDTFTQKTYHQ